MKRYPVIFKLTASLLFIILLIYALIVAKVFLYPLALAVLFSYLLYPIAHKLEEMGMARIGANLISLLFAFIVLGGLFFILIKQMSIFLNDLPRLQEKALENVEQLSLFIESKLGISTARQDKWLKDFVAGIFSSSGDVLSELFNKTTGTAVRFGLMPVYIFFMLYYRNKFKKFLLKLVSPERHDQTIHIIENISHVTKRYMGGILIVILILCVLNTLGLLIVGLQYALLLGILSAIMNFIPYFGTLIGGAIPFTFALLLGTPQVALGVIILFIIIQFTENNILTPNITGGQVSINPFATILSIIIGGMIWGIAGMFVAVPFLGMFKVICDHVEQLHPVAFLLGKRGTEEHHITILGIRNFFRKIFRINQSS